MSKPVKAMVSDELRARYTGVDSVCVVDMTGMSVQEQEQLRGVVREKSGRLEVVKNSLARRAFADSPLAPLGTSMIGPCALVTTSESIIDMAKTLVKAADDLDELKLKQAIFDGDPDLVTVKSLSQMKGRGELLGEIAVILSSPGRALAGCLAGPQSRVAGCVKTLADKAA